MICTSLRGEHYNSLKRTKPRDHQADLSAREHYQQRRIGRPKQRPSFITKGAEILAFLGWNKVR